jgi:hypothetical protein
MVYLSLDPRPGLRQGLFTTGSIDLVSSSVLAVPVSAVRVDQAQPYVLAVAGDRVEQRKVTLGQRGELQVDGTVEAAVELTGGVTEGTLLLRGSAGAVPNGSRVRLPGGGSNGVASSGASAPPTDVR